MEKEAFAVCQSVLTVDLLFRGAECILHCDHKPLELFLSMGIKTPKVHRWSMELQTDNITFMQIKSKNDVFADVISMFNI